MCEEKKDEPVKPYKTIPVSFYCDPTLFLEDKQKRQKKEDRCGDALPAKHRNQSFHKKRSQTRQMI